MYFPLDRSFNELNIFFPPQRRRHPTGRVYRSRRLRFFRHPSNRIIIYFSIFVYAFQALDSKTFRLRVSRLTRRKRILVRIRLFPNRHEFAMKYDSDFGRFGKKKIAFYLQPKTRFYLFFLRDITLAF